MNRDWVGFYVFISKAMAVLAVVSVVIIIFSYGKIEIAGDSRYSPPQEIINWPVIVGGIASAIYACLFASMFSAVRYACYFSQDAATCKQAQPAGSALNQQWMVEVACTDAAECQTVLDKVAYIGEIIGNSTVVIGPFAELYAAGRAALEIEALTGAVGRLARAEHPPK